MKRRRLLAGAAALAASSSVGRAAEKTKIVWWHAMTAALGEQVNHQVDAFNQSQNAIEAQAIYKGGYSDVLTAMIAAFRAGQAPQLAQIFEVGTGSMLAAGKATKQVWELIKETGVGIDPQAISRRCAAITACRTDEWRRCRSIHRPRSCGTARMRFAKPGSILRNRRRSGPKW